MIAVLYRSYIFPHLEETYVDNWKKIATYFVQHRGALGSTLHKTPDGLYIAYSRWPDIETWRRSWPSGDEIASALPPFIQKAIASIKKCRNPEHIFPEICMEVVGEVRRESLMSSH